MSVWHLTLDELRRRAPLWEPAAVAVGNFDGVHVGHARILRLAVEEAAAAGETPVALTFSPHPRAVVGGGPPPALSTVEHRARLMRKLGVARVVVLRFDRDVASLSPEAFVHDVLLEGLGARRIVVGEDFRFGRGAAGTPRLLEDEAGRRGAAVHVAPTVRAPDGRVVSSSCIRRLLAEGDVEAAARLLGRPYAVVGVPGGRGRSPDGEPALRVDPAPELLLPGAGEYRAELWGEHGDDRGDDDARGVPVVAVIAAGPGRGLLLRGGAPPAGTGPVRVRFLARRR